MNYSIQFERCGLVLDPVNYVLGASPDGKVIEFNEYTPYGILEVKCSEEYKDCAPTHVPYLSSSS